MTSFDISWALYSEAESTIIQTCLPDGLTWPVAKSMGVGLWVRNPTNLKTLVEKMAKSQFSEKKDPQDCALFYIALNKKPALVALFKAVQNTKIYDFLKNNFAEQKWVTAALANAYTLLSKQRYELAAAFFLLGGKLKDAVGICLQKLGDYQLALILARLVEGEGPTFEHILNTYVLPHAKETGDSTLASMGLWLLKKYSDSINALLPGGDIPGGPSITVTSSHGISQSSSNIQFNLTSSTTLNMSSVPVSPSLSHGSYSGSSGSSGSGANAVNPKLSASSTFINLISPQPSLDAKKRDLQSLLKFNPSVLHLFDFLRSHTMLRNTTLNMENLHFDLLKQAANSYTDNGYTLLAFEQLKNIAQLLLKREEAQKKEKEEKEKKGDQGEAPSIFGNYSMFWKGFDGGSSSSTTTTSAASKTLSTEKDINRSFLYKVALQLLSQHAWVVNTGGSAVMMRENFDFICKTLDIDSSVLIQEIVRFCEIRQYFRSEYELFTKDRQFMLAYSNSVHITNLSRFASLPLLNDVQSMQLFSLTRQIYDCFRAFQGDKSVSNSETIDIQCSLQLGLLLYSLTRQRYSVLQALVQNKPLQDIFKELIAVEEGKVREDEIEVKTAPEYAVDDKVLIFLKHLSHLLFIKKFHANLIAAIGNNNSTATNEANKALSRWSYELLTDINLLPENIAKAAKAQKTFSNPKGFLGLFTEFMRRSELFKSSLFASLWEFLSIDEFLINYCGEIHYKAAYIPGSEDNSLQFGEMMIVYMDRDILQSFCINSKDSTQVAMATTRGIREITLNKDKKYIFDEEGDTHSEVNMDSNHELVESMMSSKSHRKSDANSPFSPKNAKKIQYAQMVTKQMDRNIVVQWLESHPIYPYYLSGGFDGSVCLWQFNAPKDTALMATYVLPPNARVTRIHFNHRGTKFGSADIAGKLSLWRFDASEASLKPYQILNCHSKGTLDFTYINSGSLLATAGISNDKKNVCLWDTLLPPEKSIVASYPCHENGAASIVYSPRHQFLISGGKKGDIVIFDIRMQKEIHNIKAHTLNVKSLALDPSEDFFVSGSNEGNVKAWELPSFTCKETWEDIHMKHTFVRKPGIGKSFDC